jgi:DNA replication protein DnaC
LIFDDFGLESLDAKTRLTLLEILEDRHRRKASFFVSQLPVCNWHEVISDPTIADAICDCIIHHAHRNRIERRFRKKNLLK